MNYFWKDIHWEKRHPFREKSSYSSAFWEKGWLFSKQKTFSKLSSWKKQLIKCLRHWQKVVLIGWLSSQRSTLLRKDFFLKVIRSWKRHLIRESNLNRAASTTFLMHFCMTLLVTCKTGNLPKNIYFLVINFSRSRHFSHDPSSQVVTCHQLGRPSHQVNL